eukprot:gene11774-biopygen1857
MIGGRDRHGHGAAPKRAVPPKQSSTERQRQQQRRRRRRRRSSSSSNSSSNSSNSKQQQPGPEQESAGIGGWAPARGDEAIQRNSAAEPEWDTRPQPPWRRPHFAPSLTRSWRGLRRDSPAQDSGASCTRWDPTNPQCVPWRVRALRSPAAWGGEGGTPARVVQTHPARALYTPKETQTLAGDRMRTSHRSLRLARGTGMHARTAYALDDGSGLRQLAFARHFKITSAPMGWLVPAE